MPETVVGLDGVTRHRCNGCGTRYMMEHNAVACEHRHARAAARRVKEKPVEVVDVVFD